MILGVDHIALSCENVVHSAKLLAKVGYRVKFVQENLPNHPTKRALLRSYDPLHSVAYCQAKQGVSVELTQHSNPLCEAVSSYQVLLSGHPFNVMPFGGDLPPSWERSWRTALGCRQPVAAQWNSFHAQFWYDAQHDDLSSGFVRAVLVPVSKLSVSEKFWSQGLGCRVVEHGMTNDKCDWVRLAFRALVPAWSLDVILVESEPAKAWQLIDDPGFPCLALISNRLSRDKEMALKMGAREASDEFKLKVGSQLLKIVILRGPDNELIEIIQVCR